MRAAANAKSNDREQRNNGMWCADMALGRMNGNTVNLKSSFRESRVGESREIRTALGGSSRRCQVLMVTSTLGGAADAHTCPKGGNDLNSTPTDNLGVTWRVCLDPTDHYGRPPFFEPPNPLPSTILALTVSFTGPDVRAQGGAVGLGSISCYSRDLPRPFAKGGDASVASARSGSLHPTNAGSPWPES